MIWKLCLISQLTRQDDAVIHMPNVVEMHNASFAAEQGSLITLYLASGACCERETETGLLWRFAALVIVDKIPVRDLQTPPPLILDVVLRAEYESATATSAALL